MREIWLIRHGETAWNQERRWQGHTDIALNTLGERQAQALSPRLGRVSFDHVVTSDLTRAARTAELALPGRARSMDSLLREMSFGKWEGQTWEQLKESDPDGLRAWMSDPYSFCPPDGESFRDLMQRSRAWLSNIGEGRTAAVTHGGVIRAIVHSILGVPEQNAWRLNFDNCSITRIHVDQWGTTLHTLNDCSHLESLEITSQ